MSLDIAPASLNMLPPLKTPGMALTLRPLPRAFFFDAATSAMLLCTPFARPLPGTYFTTFFFAFFFFFFFLTAFGFLAFFTFLAFFAGLAFFAFFFAACVRARVA